jgi:hypothetical protein
MSTLNDVYTLLVLPNSAAVTSGHISAMADGAWGVFDASNDTAVNLGAGSGAGAANVPDAFYVAFKGLTGTLGTTGVIYRSAGQYIQLRNIRSYNESAAATAVNQQILITPNYDQVLSGSEYGIGIEFRGNTEIYGRFGYNQAKKTFVSDTHCALASEDAAYANKVLYDLFMGIVNDEDQFMDLSIAYTGSGGASTITYTTGVSGAGSGTIGGTGTLAELITLDSTAAATITITVKPLSSMYSFVNINPKFFKLRQIQGYASMSGSNCSWCTINNASVAMVYGTNYGYELKEIEYEAGGWNGRPGPYRQSALHGLPYPDFLYLVPSDTAQYTIHTLQYENESVAGWLRHKNSVTTYFISIDSIGVADLNDVMDNIVAAAGVLTP